jgi:hypothetical protein
MSSVATPAQVHASTAASATSGQRKIAQLPSELRYIQYEHALEKQYLPAIRALISKDLSEPYSIYVYRYFLYQWGDLCFMVCLQFTPPFGLAGIFQRTTRSRYGYDLIRTFAGSPPFTHPIHAVPTWSDNLQARTALLALPPNIAGLHCYARNLLFVPKPRNCYDTSTESY